MQIEELLNIKLQNADTIIILSGSDLSGIALPDNKTVVEDCYMFTPVEFNAAWQSFDNASFAQKHHKGDNKYAYDEFCKYMEDAKEINRDEYFSFSLVPQKTWEFFVSREDDELFCELEGETWQFNKADLYNNKSVLIISPDINFLGQFMKSFTMYCPKNIFTEIINAKTKQYGKQRNR